MRFELRQLVVMGLLTALSFVLMLVAFALPFLPTFLTYDLGDLPSILLAFLWGPAAGITVEFGKSILFTLFHGGSIVGLITNLLAGLLWAGTVGLVARRVDKSRTWGRVLALVLGGIVTTVGLTLGNRYFFLAAYGIPAQVIPGMTWDAILPFNLVKVTLTGIVAGVLFPYVAAALTQTAKPRVKVNL